MSKTQGFTLIEGILVIAIGAVLLASGTVMYTQYRRTVAESNALQKTVAFQALIETMAAIDTNTPANQPAFPTTAALSAGWQAKRPNDWNMSPWGGFAIVNNAPAAIMGVDAANTGLVTAGVNDNGCLHYYRGANARQRMWAVDNTGNSPTTVAYSGYLIAFVGNPPAGTPTSFSFVRGSKVATSGAVVGVIEGGGDAAAPMVPW